MTGVLESLVLHTNEKKSEGMEQLLLVGAKWFQNDLRVYEDLNWNGLLRMRTTGSPMYELFKV